MEFNQSAADVWKAEVSGALPKIFEIIDSSESNFLLIGAAVLEFYAGQTWIPGLSRQTGDLDLSVGIVTNIDEYTLIRSRFEEHGYKAKDLKYRLYPPSSIPGAAYSYIDLLAHPKDATVTEAAVKRVMGVGDDFSLSGTKFALLHTFPCSKKISIPNPFGFIRLKIAGYMDEPVRREKDFADIVELIIGLVKKGTHYDLEDTWNSISSNPEAQYVKSALQEMETNESPRWDLDNIHQSLLQRGFSDPNFADQFSRATKELLEVMK